MKKEYKVFGNNIELTVETTAPNPGRTMTLIEKVTWPDGGIDTTERVIVDQKTVDMLDTFFKHYDYVPF